MDVLLGMQSTFEFHWGKHHRAYVTNLNGQIKGTDLEGKSLEEVRHHRNVCWHNRWHTGLRCSLACSLCWVHAGLALGAVLLWQLAQSLELSAPSSWLTREWLLSCLLVRQQPCNAGAQVERHLLVGT